ncbi:uncharacterized protein Dana_GF14264 [Drosophila ananassae]|uniref:Uncharacterized protein n=1 Tax=Drosophila ananassae TaxID=7217 RepID=B3MN12_DROAN|nr:uncharacterized protein LOC6497092 [Drosophila ananassae]EDV31990.1 uncharacterized protein Dana_GF14264 [Drosophila ananassae]
MKAIVCVFVALLACVAAYDVELLTEDQWNQLVERNPAKPDTYGLILNGSAKKAIKGLINQMPCGWPQYGIPPLAPYTNADLNIHLAESVVDTLLQFLRFRLDGLDDLEIKKLKVSYTFSKKVKFHFIFKKISASAHFLDTDTFVDLLKQLGLSVRYESSGPLGFSLENLSISGEFKYKMPFIFGSIKIYKFECAVSLGGVSSNIGGLMGNGRINEFINDMIDKEVPAFINGNQAAISSLIEEIFVPLVNDHLTGHKIWYLFSLLSATTGTCNPTPAPWLAVESKRID